MGYGGVERWMKRWRWLSIWGPHGDDRWNCRLWKDVCASEMASCGIITWTWGSSLDSIAPDLTCAFTMATEKHQMRLIEVAEVHQDEKFPSAVTHTWWRKALAMGVYQITFGHVGGSVPLTPTASAL